jgi:putative transposase
MDGYESLSHTTWDCKYHVVFIPKYRRRTLCQELRRHLGEVFRKLALQKDSKVEKGHLMPDPVHMLLSMPPKYAVSQVAGPIKGKSAIHLAGVYGEHKRNFVGQHFWARGFFVSNGRALLAPQGRWCPLCIQALSIAETSELTTSCADKGVSPNPCDIADLAMIAEDLGHAPAGVQGVAREALSIEVVADRRKFSHRLANADDGWSAKSSRFHDCSVPTEVKRRGRRSRR